MKRLSLLLFALLVGCGGSGASSHGSDTPHGGDTPHEEVASATCSPTNDGVNWQALLALDCDKLSDYGLFQDRADPTRAPNTPGIPFQPAIALFSDYAQKARFVFIPPGKQVEFMAQDAFEFPIGSVLVKSFSLPRSDDVNAETELIETRLLIKREEGWVGLPYVWDTDKQDATLRVTGAQISWYMERGGVSTAFTYGVPDRNQCKICHQLDTGTQSKITPIGIKARHLNHPIDFGNGSENQLKQWQQLGILAQLPMDLGTIASIPVWNGHEQATRTAFAKGYLDINCSHCHNPAGFASISGLRLEYWRDENSFSYGICKQPPGYDGGEAGLSFDIYPGNGDASIIPYRMSLSASNGHAKDQMPPLGRSLNHVEGIELIRRWIDGMAYQDCR